MSSNQLFTLLTEMSGNIGKIEGTLSGIKQKLDTIDERLDKVMTQKPICEKRFASLEAHKNKLIGIAI